MILGKQVRREEKEVGEGGREREGGKKAGEREESEEENGGRGRETPPGPVASDPNQRGPLERLAVETPREPQVPSSCRRSKAG